jgi:hypothetical protein
VNNDYSAITKIRDTYILRVWKENPMDADWRGQVQHARSGERVSFKNLEDLFAFLRKELGEDPEEEGFHAHQGLR